MEEINDLFRLENALNVTHVFLHDDFNKKIKQIFFVKIVMQKDKMAYLSYLFFLLNGGAKKQKKTNSLTRMRII